jgi:hypothetical protein
VIEVNAQYYRNKTEARYQGAFAFLDGKYFNKSNILAHSSGHIYSYGTHFLMAEKQDDGSILVNTSKYSVTTSKHQSALATVLSVAGYAPVDGPLERLPNSGQSLENYQRWIKS